MLISELMFLLLDSVPDA